MRGAAVALAAVVALAGCGAETSARTSTTSDATATEQPSSDSSAEPGSASGAADDKDEADTDKGKGTDKASPAIPADAPACDAVWQDGTRLARDYEGCMAGSKFVAVDQEPCSFGQRLVRFGDHFYAVRGGPVNHTATRLTKDRDYRGAIASCRA